MMKALFSVPVLIFLLQTNVFAQCPAGQANVTIKVYGDEYVNSDPTRLTCTINGTTVLNAVSFPTPVAAAGASKWYTFTVPCTAAGGKIVVRLTDGFGDGVNLHGAAANGNNVLVFVNNELVDSLAFTNGANATTSSHNTNFTTNAGTNSTCATASAGTVATFASGASVSGFTGIQTQQANAIHNGFNQLPTTVRTECGTFVATSSSMDVFAYASISTNPGTGTLGGFGSFSAQVYNSACTPVGGAIGVQGGAVTGLTAGQTYTLCGSRTSTESAQAPATLTVLDAIGLAVRPTSIVPVRLIEFYGVGAPKQNLLSWKTANEQDIEQYQIERSSNGVSYIAIGSVAGRNNSIQNDYSFTDFHFLNGKNYYRLKVIEFTGKTYYSDVIALTAKSAEFQVLTAYPNPANDILYLPTSGPAPAEVVYAISDLAGKTLRSGRFNAASGNDTKSLSVAGLGTGCYILKLTNKENQLISVQKIYKK